MSESVRMTVVVSGRVQGVGFRWWTRSQALALGLRGFARNTDDGKVEIVAEGSRVACERLHGLLEEFPSSTGRPGWARFVSEPRWGIPREPDGFRER